MSRYIGTFSFKVVSQCAMVNEILRIRGAFPTVAHLGTPAIFAQ